ncbi:hypothetical protein WHR41_02830 [Cladosporium halotolerans]|uniref:DUF221-domain-containing protein n=1 Tax=Cladosporium halotolerans TaxID=1052096 RepID=A0AB34KSW5_9PEZI
MDLHMLDDHAPGYRDLLGASTTRETSIQIALSLALGIGAFFAFCILRTRWPGLYAARKKHLDAGALPELPDTMFGWIGPLWRITDQQVLASAGLDAYAFLAFFKMAMKFCFITLFFSLIVIKPVHDAYEDDDDLPGNDTDHNSTEKHHNDMRRSVNLFDVHSHNYTVPGFPDDFETDYLWMYVAFAYLFTGIAVYMVFAYTRKIIEVRQDYLGSQTTVTDRTIRLSGIPAHLQEEEKIKEFIESLDIGKVDSVTICRDWKELDTAMTNRTNTMRRLEEAYAVHMGFRTVERNLESLPIAQPPPPAPTADGVPELEQENTDEHERLVLVDGQPHVRPYAKLRPKTRIWYGRFGLQSRKVDAIDYYQEKLREADAEIKRLREKEYPATPIAFVTMDSVAACQMAIQAVLDPSPLQLIANPSPAPSEVMWRNTYLPRRSRMIRSWSVTLGILFLSIFWSIILVPVAGLLNTDTIGKVFPQLAEFLDAHKNIKSLVAAQLPTLIASLLMVLVPYMYYYLSWYQGWISLGDMELSAISKNFLFVFINFFVVFTALGTFSQFYQFFERFGDALRDFRRVAITLAVSLQKLLGFYVNFIILQGLGLLPFRLLEFGSVVLYPIYLMGAKTPRDYAELVQPPTFSYGFYLPTSLLVYIICMVYSVLHSSWRILLAGSAYFALGHFVYKYQLLYAMDHQQHSTGRGWGMICDRIFVGLVFFQITTAGQLILRGAIPRSLLLVPLIIGTIWMSIAYGNTYKPLLRFIALRSVRRAEQTAYEDEPDNPVPSGYLSPDRNPWADAESVRNRWGRDGRARGKDASSDTSMRFVNPSLVAPLDPVWITEAETAAVEDANLLDGDVDV